MRKIAIIYQGAVSLLEISYLNHKKYIFDYLNNNDIDYDVFLSIANECIYKDANIEQLDKFNKIVNKKLNKKVETNYQDVGINYKGVRYYLENTEILNILKKMFCEDKLKFIEFVDNYNNCKTSNEYSIIGDAHDNENIPKTTSYKRIDKIDNFISTNKTDEDYIYYIYLRCDYLFHSDFNLKDHLIPKTVTTSPHQQKIKTIRPDFIWISEKKYTEYINTDTIKEMKLIEPDNDITNIFHYDMHKLYKYIESLGENIILNYKGNRVGVWEFFKFLPAEEKKIYFNCF